MHFLTNQENGLFTHRSAATHGSLMIQFRQQPRHILATLLGEEQPANMLTLLSTLVVLLHIAGFIWLQRPVEQETQAEPLVMAVEMITMAVPKPVVAKPIPPVSPPPAKKLEPVKPKVRPLPRKSEPVTQRTPDAKPAAPAMAESQPSAQTISTESNAASESKTSAVSQAEQFTEANYRANYAHNPKPEYPAVAKSRNWQGKVMLRVQVSAEGLSNAVSVEHSSGHEMLDESAVEAVRNWRFIPAKRGETPIASSVLVPIVFSLRESN